MARSEMEMNWVKPWVERGPILCQKLTQKARNPKSLRSNRNSAIQGGPESGPQTHDHNSVKT